MIIRTATTVDIPQIVNIHMNAFEGFFLTSLGRSFLSFYYKAFIKSKDGVVLCAVLDNNVCGFAAATKQCKGYNSNLIKANLISFVCLSVRLLFTKPSALIRLVKNISKKSDVIDDPEDYAELYSIGIKDSVQGKGIGKKLLATIEKRLKCEGVEKISLTTDFYKNDSTIAFYRTMGYKTLYEFTSYPNRRMYRFIKYLNK
jgi:ribosomal protein S18 acetylase RimI-like enzyme